MRVQIRDDGQIPSVEEAIADVDWRTKADRVATGLLASPLPMGLLFDAVLQSPIAFASTSLLSGPSLGAIAFQLSSTLKVGGVREAFLEWLKGRWVVQRLDPTTGSLTWFECHVPHGGWMNLKVQTSKTRKASISVKLYGAAFEKGRKVTIKVTDDSEPRTQCALYFLDFVVRPVLYELREHQQVWGAEIERVAGDRTVTLQSCPDCLIPPSAIDRSVFEIDQYIDRRNDTVKTKRTYEVAWEREHLMEASLPIPHVPGASVGLKAFASASHAWNATYTFQPGSLYQPYRPLGADWAMRKWAFE